MNVRESIVRRYQLMTVGLLVLFLYVSATELVDRWGETIRLYSDLEQKEQQSPENLISRKYELQARQQALAAKFTKDVGRFEQSETGVVEFLDVTGRETGVTIESLTPATSERAGRIQEVSFSVKANADYHAIARFVNQLETAAMMVQMKTIELSAPQKGSSRLSARVEGSAFIMPGR